MDRKTCESCSATDHWAASLLCAPVLSPANGRTDAYDSGRMRGSRAQQPALGKAPGGRVAREISDRGRASPLLSRQAPAHSECSVRSAYET